MARLRFPDSASVDRVQATADLPLLSASGATATVYVNEAGTQLADILNADGSANATSTLLLDDLSRLPEFLGPTSGADVLYVRVDGGAPLQVEAQLSQRFAAQDLRTLDTLDAFQDAERAFNAGTFVSAYLPEKYGAVSDGITNDAPAIQAAVNAAEAAGGGTVHCGPGTYAIASRIVIPAGVNLTGAGNGEDKWATRFLCTSVGAGISFGTRFTGGRGGTSGNFTVHGNDLATNPLYIGLTVERTFIGIDSSFSTGTGVLVEASQNNTFVGLNSSHHDGAGIVLDYGCGGNAFYRFESDSCNIGAIIRNSGTPPFGVYEFPVQNGFYHSLIERHTTACFQVLKGTDNFVQGTYFSAEDNTGRQLVTVDGGGVLRVDACLFQSNTVAGGVGVLVSNGSLALMTGGCAFVGLAAATKVQTGGSVEADHLRLASTPLVSDPENFSDFFVRSRRNIPLEFRRPATALYAILAGIDGESDFRFTVGPNGSLSWGDGTNPADVVLRRDGVNILKVDQDFRIGGKVGFYNGSPLAKQVITGSRADGGALQDLLGKLDALGLIDDQTSL